jgi:putative nucleotidyltransferase with HDIG domain
MKGTKQEHTGITPLKLRTEGLFSDGATLLQKIGVLTILKNSPFQKLMILAILTVSMTILLYPIFVMPSANYQIGDIAKKDIKATQDYLIEDELSTQKRRSEAMEESPAVYDLDETVLSGIRMRLENSFKYMRDLYQEMPDGLQAQRKALWSKQKGFEDLLGISVKENIFEILVEEKFSPVVERTTFQLIHPYLKAGVVENKSVWSNEREKGVILRGIQTKKESFVRDLDSLWDMRSARRDIRPRAMEEFGGQVKSNILEAAIIMAQNMILPNLTLNKNATEEKRIKAGDTVRSVFFQVKKGEMIVREGERIDENSLKKLNAQAQTQTHKHGFMMALGSALILGILLCVGYNAAHLHVPRFPSSNRDVLFLGVILASMFALTDISTFIAGAIHKGFPYIPQGAVLYGIPVAAGGMLVSIFLGPQIAMIFSFIVSVCCSFLMENSLQFFIYFSIGSLTAAHGMIHCKERGTQIRVGLLVGLVNMGVIIAINMFNETLFSAMAPMDLLFGIMGGIFVGIIGTGLSPLIEMIFGYTSNIKLLELMSVDQPLLKELMVQAPGTYHHSVLVSNLAEAGAEAINANYLLAKVSGYYHDIGKLKKPLYFVENETGAESRHGKLAPSMSALILISHVRDGVELAKQHKLGQSIIDIIKQHHGTRLISFFYEKAKRLKGTDSSTKVDDFRYPGPKPQTKEAGLVMLADTVEAAARTLVDPTPARVQGMVQKIMNNVFSDGQLEECELTLKDLHKIANSFTKILNGIFHHRIEYPEPAAKVSTGRRKQTDDMDKERPKQDKDRQQEDKKDSEESLKRLGM